MVSGQRRRPSKYPVELRERAVRMVLEVQKESAQSFGVITRVAKELGIGAESLRKWVTQVQIGGGASPVSMARLKSPVVAMRSTRVWAVFWGWFCRWVPPGGRGFGVGPVVAASDEFRG